MSWNVLWYSASLLLSGKNVLPVICQYGTGNLNSTRFNSLYKCVWLPGVGGSAFSLTENRGRERQSYIIPDLAATCQQHCYVFSHTYSKKAVRDYIWSVNNMWTMRPHTWQVCGIGRGNHSVHLEWALCFHLGQWCRRGNFQLQPDSLSARWKRLTSWK